ncbi:MAG: DUF58 domain-containing protein [Methylococcaceae bacterium]|nr:DUF58 domain-containing protein [Methylococcaceae bacterium]
MKDYQPGDSIKHIHWKAFAKGQGLKLNQPKIFCGYFRSLFQGKF